MKYVRDIMSGPVITVEPDATAADAARLMRDEDAGDVVVISDGQLRGIVTDRDLAVRLIAEDLDPELPVGELCTTDPITVTPDESLNEAAETMREYSIRRLPVCENNAVVGFLSLGDLAQELDPNSALSEISGSAPNW